MMLLLHYLLPQLMQQQRQGAGGLPTSQGPAGMGQGRFGQMAPMSPNGLRRPGGDPGMQGGAPRPGGGGVQGGAPRPPAPGGGIPSLQGLKPNVPPLLSILQSIPQMRGMNAPQAKF